MVISCNLLAIFEYEVIPPDSTMMACRLLQISALYFIMKLKVALWIHMTLCPGREARIVP